MRRLGYLKIGKRFRPRKFDCNAHLEKAEGSIKRETSNGFKMREIARLQDFAQTAESIAATTKKLEKTALLGDYLRTLSDPDLNRAARYFAGHQFAQSDSRTTNVGGSII